MNACSTVAASQSTQRMSQHTPNVRNHSTMHTRTLSQICICTIYTLCNRGGQTTAHKPHLPCIQKTAYEPRLLLFTIILHTYYFKYLDISVLCDTQIHTAWLWKSSYIRIITQCIILWYDGSMVEIMWTRWPALQTHLRILCGPPHKSFAHPCSIMSITTALLKRASRQSSMSVSK